MFRGDFEFHDGVGPSHLGAGVASAPPRVAQVAETQVLQAAALIESPATAPANSNAASANPDLTWAMDAEAELKKIPFFVRGKARRNTERFARDHNISVVTLETLYNAKAHFSS
jgi:light-independent protochlorophyllide reductase subunit B